MKFALHFQVLFLLDVTPFAGVWIEIKMLKKEDRKPWSLPSRECGLKSRKETESGENVSSLPSRECGLKFYEKDGESGLWLVTPFAGVWIEIPQRANLRGDFMSLPSRECGLKYYVSKG